MRGEGKKKRPKGADKQLRKERERKKKIWKENEKCLKEVNIGKKRERSFEEGERRRYRERE